MFIDIKHQKFVTSKYHSMESDDPDSKRANCSVAFLISLFVAALLYAVSFTDLYIYPAIFVAAICLPWLCCHQLPRWLFVSAMLVIIIKNLIQ